MRIIDADALENILSNAIEMMRLMAKALDSEDDPEIQMEIKAYTDILNGVKEQPTIEPERKTGEWIEEEDDTYTIHTHCSVCGELAPLICRSNDHGYHLYGETLKTKYCPNCGSLLLGGEENAGS